MRNLFLALVITVSGSAALADVTWVQTCTLTAQSTASTEVPAKTIVVEKALITNVAEAAYFTDKNPNRFNLVLSGVAIEIVFRLNNSGHWESMFTVKDEKGTSSNFYSDHSPTLRINTPESNIRLNCQIDV